jgi:D-methionine transport system substrate-binding protein
LSASVGPSEAQTRTIIAFANVSKVYPSRNTNYATQAGFDPVKDAILREDPKGPYVNILVVRTADKDKPWVKLLVQSYQTPEIRDFVLAKFKGAVLAAW